MEKILEIRDLAVNYYSERKVVRALNGLSLDMTAGKVLGLVGGNGSGQDHPRPFHSQHYSGASGQDHERLDPFRRQGCLRHVQTRTPRHEGQGHGHDLPGPHDGPQSRPLRGRADRRNRAQARKARQGRCLEKGRSHARNGGNTGGAGEGISAPVLRRDEAARRHRPRSRLQPQAPPRGRNLPPPWMSPSRPRSSTSCAHS